MWFKRRPKFNNRAEAEEMLKREINKKKGLPYDELLKWVNKGQGELYELVGNSGIKYSLEFSAYFVENQQNGPIRLTGIIEGGDANPISPVELSLVKAPDDKFVGE